MSETVLSETVVGPFPEGPNLEKNQSRLNAWKIQVFAWNSQSRLKTSISLENFQSWPWEFPTTKKGIWWWLAWNFQSRLKMSFVSISLENFNPGGRSGNFSIHSDSARCLSGHASMRGFKTEQDPAQLASLMGEEGTYIRGKDEHI